MNTLLQQIVDFMEKREWHYSVSESGRTVFSSFTGKNARWEVLLLLNQEEGTMSCLSLLPSKATGAQVSKAADLLARLNYGLQFGCFKLDHKDGEMHYATSLHSPEGELTTAQLEHLMFINFSTVDRHYDVIMKVLHGGVSPLLALAGVGHQAGGHSADNTAKENPRFDMN